MQKDSLKAIRLGFLGGMAFVLGMAVTSLLASELVNGLWRFSSNDVLSSTEINHNFDTLNARIDSIVGGVDAVPVGTILAWHKSFTGTPALPVGYVECNGQVLSDTASPYNGQTIPNLNSPVNAWNSRGSFLRGDTTSGTFENDIFQGHYHTIFKPTNIFEWHYTVGSGTNSLAAGPNDSHREGVTTTGYGVTAPIDGTNGTVRFGDETRPVSMSVVWIIKVT